MSLQIKLWTIFFTFDCVLTAVIENNYSNSHKDLEKTRELRSADCVSCNLNIHEVYHQTFNAHVEFNQFIISDCTNSDGNNCTDKPVQNQSPTPAPVPHQTMGTSGHSLTSVPTVTVPIPTTVPTATTQPIIRQNKTKQFRLKFETQKYGLDLYYLMDGTGTFEYSREQLANKSLQFVKSFKNLSSDYRLGLGVFVDKHGQPQRRSINDKIISQGRQIRDTDSQFGYGLWNKMPLTKNLENFDLEVKGIETVTSGFREDILSGVHQCAVCTSKIGWRQKTKRFLLVTTDERYYKAGDKTVSADNTTASTYDGKCGLDDDNIYDGPQYDKVDYPSEEQIRTALNENGITVIFAIDQSPIADPPEPVIDTYNILAENIIPKPTVVPLNAQSPTIIEDIIDIIHKAYHETDKSIVIETKLSGPEEITKNFNFTTKCLGKTIKVDKSNKKIDEECEIPNGGVVEYQVEVTVPCPWTYKDVKLTSDTLGHSDDGLDIASVCNCCNGEGCTCAPTPELVSTTSRPQIFKNKTKKFLMKMSTKKLGLDLFLLIDATRNFNNTKIQLLKKSNQFTESLRNLSRYNRLGLGYFTDKYEEDIKNDGTKMGLITSLPLTKNLGYLESYTSNISLNSRERLADVLTGLHQSLVCESKLGWTSNRRKFILVVTNQKYHKAGDKITNNNPNITVTPYSEKCHLVNLKEIIGAVDDDMPIHMYEGNDYENVDYPSENQIITTLNSTGATVIFAIEESSDADTSSSVIDAYTELSKNVIPKPVVFPLNISSPTVVEDLIAVIDSANQRNIKSIQIETKLSGPQGSTHKVIFNTKCKGKIIGFPTNNKHINECETSGDSRVEYEVEVTVPCPWIHNEVELTSHNIEHPNQIINIDIDSVCH